MDIQAGVRGQAYTAGAVLAASTSNALIPQVSCIAKQFSTQVVRREGSRPALPAAGSAHPVPALASCSRPPTPARDAAGGKTGSAAWQQRARRGVQRGGHERAAVPRPLHIGADSGASTTRRREREFSSDLRVEGVSI
ncbi:hypothetical protein HWV62_24342 [Athelia sp. TMB]|nr:hypothetical protein HWV62_24342 [Athelia sp. TMB]